MEWKSWYTCEFGLRDTNYKWRHCVQQKIFIYSSLVIPTQFTQTECTHFKIKSLYFFVLFLRVSLVFKQNRIEFALNLSSEFPRMPCKEHMVFLLFKIPEWLEGGRENESVSSLKEYPSAPNYRTFATKMVSNFKLVLPLSVCNVRMRMCCASGVSGLHFTRVLSAPMNWIQTINISGGNN